MLKSVSIPQESKEKNMTFYRVCNIEVKWKIDPPFGRLKNVKNNNKNLVSPDAVSGMQKCSKIRLQPRLRPGPCWGSLQCSPRPPSWITGPTSKGRGAKERRSPKQNTTPLYMAIHTSGQESTWGSKIKSRPTPYCVQKLRKQLLHHSQQYTTTTFVWAIFTISTHW